MGLRVLLGGVVASLLLLVGASAAYACNNPSLAVFPDEARPGDPVNFSISDVEAGADWSVSADGTAVASGTATDKGVSGTFTMPKEGPVGVEARVSHDGEGGPWFSSRTVKKPVETSPRDAEDGVDTTGDGSSGGAADPGTNTGDSTQDSSDEGSKENAPANEANRPSPDSRNPATDTRGHNPSTTQTGSPSGGSAGGSAPPPSGPPDGPQGPSDGPQDSTGGSSGGAPGGDSSSSAGDESKSSAQPSPLRIVHEPKRALSRLTAAVSPASLVLTARSHEPRPGPSTWLLVGAALAGLCAAGCATALVRRSLGGGSTAAPSVVPAPSGPQADDDGASAKELEVEAELQEMIAEQLAAELLATTAAESEDDDAGDRATIVPMVP